MPRTANHQAIPPEPYTPAQIKQLRQTLALSQNGFAELLGVSKRTVEAWEAGRNIPEGPAQRLMTLFDQMPHTVWLFLKKQKTATLRLYYYHQDKLCTIIDVDEKGKQVAIENFTNDLLHRAFGCNQTPTYEDYEEFLQSRCFPPTRDKLKLVLRELELPFYDPLAIVEKTQGRMAEDQQWLYLERSAG